MHDDLQLADLTVGAFLEDTAEPEAGAGALPPELPGSPLPVAVAAGAAGDPAWDPEAFAEAAVQTARQRTGGSAGELPRRRLLSRGQLGMGAPSGML